MNISDSNFLNELENNSYSSAFSIVANESIDIHSYYHDPISDRLTIIGILESNRINHYTFLPEDLKDFS